MVRTQKTVLADKSPQTAAPLRVSVLVIAVLQSLIFGGAVLLKWRVVLQRRKLECKREHRGMTVGGTITDCCFVDAAATDTYAGD